MNQIKMIFSLQSTTNYSEFVSTVSESVLFIVLVMFTRLKLQKEKSQSNIFTAPLLKLQKNYLLNNPHYRLFCFIRAKLKVLLKAGPAL